ncbi:MAG: transcriptional regulator [Myxococcaceae bacterium]|nr:transcriptional regulator [Myxococcaceae bacterium]
MKQVRIWAYDDILASGVTGVTDVFAAANALWARERAGSAGVRAPLGWSVESLDGKPVRTASGQLVAVDGQISYRTSADAIVVTAPFMTDLATFVGRPALKPLLAALRRQHARGALLASYCTGSFVLAEAGLLDHRVATTHWAKASAFARRYPDVTLRAAEVLTEQNGILCGGAGTTYLQLALRLVERLAGGELAAAVGRMLLIDTSRTSQMLYARRAEEERDTTPHDELLTRAQHWMAKQLARPFRLSELARHVGASERTVGRRFQQLLGESPLHHLQSLRLELAQQLLEHSSLHVAAVGERVGYGDSSAFRALFKRRTGLSPREYRQRRQNAVMAETTR